MLCLMSTSAKELCARLEHIPHGRTQAVYKAILDGGDIPELPSVADKLRADLEYPPAPPALADGVAELDLGGGEGEGEAEGGAEGGYEQDDMFDDVFDEAFLKELGAGEHIDSDEALELKLFGDMPPSPEEPPLPPPGHAPLAGEVDTALEPAAPAPAAGPVAQVYGADRVPHPDWPITLGGRAIGSIKYDTVRCQLSAHCCETSGHGAQCRLNRTCKPSTRGKLEQGRPLGLLLAWLDCHEKFASKAEHRNITTGLNIVRHV